MSQNVDTQIGHRLKWMMQSTRIQYALFVKVNGLNSAGLMGRPFVGHRRIKV